MKVRAILPPKLQGQLHLIFQPQGWRPSWFLLLALVLAQHGAHDREGLLLYSGQAAKGGRLEPLDLVPSCTHTPRLSALPFVQEVQCQMRVGAAELAAWLP